MRWKRMSNFIIASILSIIFTIVTLLNIIGPLHVNRTGNINPLGPLFFYSILYWVIALSLTWAVYFFMKKKPEAQFFTLLVLGIVLIIFENFLWAWMGS